MSSGEDHDKHGCVAATAVFVVSTLTWAVGVDHALYGLPVGLGVFIGTWWLSPDLDLDYSRPAKRWGPLRIFWIPYARFFVHRGLSHHWFWGPASRLAYLFILVSPIFYWIDVPPVRTSVVAFFFGVVAGNWLHLLADGVLFSR